MSYLFYHEVFTATFRPFCKPFDSLKIQDGNIMKVLKKKKRSDYCLPKSGGKLGGSKPLNCWKFFERQRFFTTLFTNYVLNFLFFNNSFFPAKTPCLSG